MARRRSHWDGRNSVNAFSIGVELDNAGRLEGTEGRWTSWQGVPIPAGEVVVRAHAADGVERGWQSYTPEQMEAATNIAALLVGRYGVG